MLDPRQIPLIVWEYHFSVAEQLSYNARNYSAFEDRAGRH
jgi:hypothetical protein